MNIQPITQANNSFIWNGDFESRHIPKEAGMRWDRINKKWKTTDIDVVAKLKDYVLIGSATAIALESHLKEKQQAIEKSRAVKSDINVPVPDGLAYRPFQLAGIEYALEKGNAIIGDQMGLGKTISALGVINACEDIKRVLIICPASLRLNWQREAEKWLVRDFRIKVLQKKEVIEPGDEIVIINYDIVKKHLDAIHSIDWDLMVVDEAHYLKNPKAQRTRNILGGKTKTQEWQPIEAGRKLYLTGTPIVNRPIEAQTLLASLQPNLFGNFWKYANRYCAAYRSRWGWDFTGASNLDELQEKLREHCMIRRLKSEVLDELPAKQRSIIEMPVNGSAKFVKAEQQATIEFEEQLIELKAAVELAKASDDPEVYNQAVAELRKVARVHFESISELRKQTALAKAPLVAQYVSDAIEEMGNKVIVFAHHRDVVELLCEELAGHGAVRIMGGDKLEDRQAAVDAFQNDPDTKVFVGSIQAAGVGLTLTASSHVVFAELDWVPGNMSQAEDRAHRIGQQNQVLIQHLVLENSIDANMAKAIVEKQQVIDKALDKQAAGEAIMAIGTGISPINTSRKQLEEVAVQLTIPEIDTIHSNLQYLARRCDGAEAIDGQGFNKVDTRIGKSLAAATKLTAKQAALGRKILHKYKTQLGG